MLAFTRYAGTKFAALFVNLELPKPMEILQF